MLRQTRMEVDLGALEENYGKFRKYLRSSCQVMGVVKANGYGMGMLEVTRTLSRAGCQRFAVATPDEAVFLRESGIPDPLLVLGASPREAAGVYVEKRISAALVEPSFAEHLSREAVQQGRPALVHVKVDTGMGRVGMLLEELPKLLDLLEKLPGIEVEGLFTHFATADERNPGYTEEQFRRYNEAWEIFRSHQKRISLRHVCNTAGTLNFPAMHLDAVRVGIGLYGMRPSSFCSEPFRLKPVFRVVTAVSQLRHLPSRWGVGYGLRYMTRGEDRIAVLPLGYHDGFSRGFSGKAQVLIRGERAPIVGSVCMDQIMAEVTHIPEVREGDEVVIIGTQGEECISPEELASHLGTINYEIPHLFSVRVPKVYL